MFNLSLLESSGSHPSLILVSFHRLLKRKTKGLGVDSSCNMSMLIVDPQFFRPESVYIVMQSSISAVFRLEKDHLYDTRLQQWLLNVELKPVSQTSRAMTSAFSPHSP